MDELTAVGASTRPPLPQISTFHAKNITALHKTSSPMATKIFSCGWRNAGEDGGEGGGGWWGKISVFQEKVQFFGRFLLVLTK